MTNSSAQESRLLQLSDFDFAVPEDLIAHQPLAERDASRMLIHDRSGAIAHGHVKDLSTLLPAGTLLILNNTRVIAGRLYGTIPTGARVEVLLLEPKDSASGTHWLAIGRPLRKLRVGSTLSFAAGLEAKIVAVPETTGEVSPFEIAFNVDTPSLLNWLSKHGFIPLPPYISRPKPLPAAESADAERYQTVYAKAEGSVAAPTAGLHFTPELMSSLRAKGITTAEVTLHVGAGTFLPVRDDDITKHTMHEERFMVPAETFRAICQAKAEGRPVVAVGTTSLRCLEGFSETCDGDERRMAQATDQWQRTRLYVHPRTAADRYVPRHVDALLTNFHQPRSTLFMLICALIGWRKAHQVYAEAIKERYRLFSYGDACFLWLPRS